MLSHKTLTDRLKQEYLLLRHADKERLLLVPDLLVVSILVILEEGNHALFGLEGGSGVSVPVNVINPVGLVVVPVDKVHSKHSTQSVHSTHSTCSTQSTHNKHST